MVEVIEAVGELLMDEDFSGVCAAYEIRDWFKYELREDLGELGKSWSADLRKVVKAIEEIVVDQWMHANPDIMH